MKPCLFCNKEFRDTPTLNRHLERKVFCVDMKLLHSKYENLLKSNQIINNDSHNTNCHNTININVSVNPITKLEISHLNVDKIKDYIENYKNNDKLNLFLADYIKDIICHKDHPENHAVKYIRKYPPTYNSLIEKDGEVIGVVKGLKETCELLSNPILNYIL